jgi:DNA-binding FrmR family transcriptional regulator
MRVGPDAAAIALVQMRPLEGQIHELIAALEKGHDCEQAIAGLATISHSLSRAGFWLLATQLRQCLATASSSDERGRNLQQLETLFLSLS